MVQDRFEPLRVRRSHEVSRHAQQHLRLAYDSLIRGLAVPLARAIDSTMAVDDRASAVPPVGSVSEVPMELELCR
jgi:hypothetical protein